MFAAAASGGFPPPDAWEYSKQLAVDSRQIGSRIIHLRIKIHSPMIVETWRAASKSEDRSPKSEVGGEAFPAASDRLPV